jgi:hypothetical protein
VLRHPLEIQKSQRCGPKITNTSWLRFFSILLYIGLTQSVLAARLQVYFLAVGSSTYAAPEIPNQQGLGDIYGANNGARALAQRLARGGAEFGLTLTSDEGHLVTVADIKAALNRVEAVMAGARPGNPLLIFYIASHGVADGIAWNHFSLPGTFLYQGDPNHLSIDGLAKSALHAGSLVDDLEKLKTPFMVILDTCYEGKSQGFQSQALTAVASRNLTDVASALRVFNEFREPNPVLFSTPPGTVVEVAPDPNDPKSRNVGPLARRAMLILDASLRGRQEISLSDFVQQMSRPGLDSLTKPAVTHATPAAFWSNSMVFPTPSPRSVEARLGTGTKGEVCCGARASNRPSQAADLAESGSVTGRIELNGSSGEFVTSGRKVVLSSLQTKIEMQQDGPGSVTFSVESGTTSWEVELSTPDGSPFSKRRYANAQRNGFADQGRPGLSISGGARSCNELNGSFVVTDVVYDSSNRLTKLSASAIQFCDDVRSPLNALLAVEIGAAR